jgi:MOSC domain-containing protein YiiM
MTSPRIGRVLSLNVGTARQVDWQGRTVTTAIWKKPLPGRHVVAGVNVVGDDQADRRVHGGPTKALYAYRAEDYRWWSSELGRAFSPGTFGENLTVEDVDIAASVVGERWRVGTTVLRVTEPRIPCYKLGIRMGNAAFVDRFAAAARPGTYLAIEQSGEVGAGDAIERIDRPGHGLTVGIVERAYHGHDDLLPRLLDVEDLSTAWREWAAKALVRARRAG